MKRPLPRFPSASRGAAPALRAPWFLLALGLFVIAGPPAPASPAAVAPPSLETDGTILVARSPAGAMLAYTLNGVDPRGPADMLGLGAQLTSQPLVVGAGTLLVVRALNPAAMPPASPWSAALAARDAVRVDARTAGPLFAARLANLSALVDVNTAASAPIVGFVVAGANPHWFLVRAVGPALAQFGVAGALADPECVLRRSDGTVLARTTGWTAEPTLPRIAATVGAFPLPDASADCACLVQLPPGAYTLQVNSVTGQAGVALVEVYDVDRASGFACVSTRATIGPSRRTVTGGFVVEGSVPRKLLVRAVGPGLGALGVAGALGHPSLTLFSGTTAIASNADWELAAAEVAAAASASGAFRLAPGSADAAVVVTLAPGAYTAQVTASGAERGAFLLEVYPVP